MDDRPAPALPPGISQELWDKVSGGDCTANELTTFNGELHEQYQALVDFTSYVIERVTASL
jgi:hypothetical protein